KRYGIQSVLIDDYTDIKDILLSIERKYKTSKIFISGSAEEYGDYSEGESKELLHSISNSLVRNNYHVISGFGLGVGSYIINGALEELYKNKEGRINDYLTLRPFPHSDSGERSLKTLWTEYRNEMISEAGVMIFVFGNKMLNDEVVEANGVIEEYEIARKKGKYLIPL